MLEALGEVGVAQPHGNAVVAAQRHKAVAERRAPVLEALGEVGVAQPLGNAVVAAQRHKAVAERRAPVM